MITDDLMVEFYQTVQQYGEELSAAFSSKDWEQVHKVSHNIKGCGAPFGHPRLSALGAMVCERVDEGEQDSVGVVVGELLAEINGFPA